jgi:hypothetical protein
MWPQKYNQAIINLFLQKTVTFGGQEVKDMNIGLAYKIL